jgi:hypothetical protein
MKAMITAAAAAVLIALTLTGCAGGGTSPAPAVTVTHTVTSTHVVIKAQGTAAPAPTVTKTVTQTAPAPAVTQTVSAPAPSQASGGGSTSSGSGKGHAIARFNGSGTQNTASFTTPDNWALSWSYWGCSGGSGNFIVTEYNTDGSIDVNGVSVNELGSGRGSVATYAYGDAGTHYFSVISVCSWSLVPVTV